MPLPEPCCARGWGIGALGHCPKESAWRGIQEEFPEIVWDHSHVVLDESGTVRTYCVYDAPNEELVRRAAKLGGRCCLDLRDRGRMNTRRLPAGLGPPR